jgi:hypothetical protein
MNIEETRRHRMTKKILLVALTVLVFSVVFPPSSYAWRGHHGGGPGGSGLYAAGALVGGLLLGTAIGTALSQPHYYAPTPVYAYPAPTSIYATPVQSPAYVRDEPPGEWVTVPGRWINGRWVPAHKVWTPITP